MQNMSKKVFCFENVDSHVFIKNKFFFDPCNINQANNDASSTSNHIIELSPNVLLHIYHLNDLQGYMTFVF